MKAKARGFTLLELLVVIVVIGILASLALPRMVKVLEKARTAEARQNLGDLRSAEGRYDAEQQKITTVISELDTDDPNGVDPRYYNYTIVDANPVCNGDPAGVTSTYWVQAERTAAHHRPEQPSGLANKPYTIVLSGAGNLCDNM